jgi:hypothetical protein
MNYTEDELLDAEQSAGLNRFGTEFFLRATVFYFF